MQLGFGKLLRVGPLTFSPPTVTGATDRAGTNLGRSTSAHVAGLIGAIVLAQFLVTIDYQSGRAYFEPVPGRKLSNILHGTGMIFDKRDHEAFEVLDILKGTAAERARLHRRNRRATRAQSINERRARPQLNTGPHLADDPDFRPAPDRSRHWPDPAVTRRRPQRGPHGASQAVQ